MMESFYEYFYEFLCLVCGESSVDVVCVKDDF